MFIFLFSDNSFISNHSHQSQGSRHNNTVNSYDGRESIRLRSLEDGEYVIGGRQRNKTISRETLQTKASSNMNNLNDSVFLRVEGGDETHMRKDVSVADSNTSLDLRDNTRNGYGTLSRLRSSRRRCYS